MKDFSYRDGRNTAPLRLETQDQGLVFECGHGPEKRLFGDFRGTPRPIHGGPTIG
jgi:hypothetical protein